MIIKQTKENKVKTKTIKDYKNFLHSNYDIPNDKCFYTLKNCKPKYQIYIDREIFDNGAIRYVVFWYDMNSHTNIGSYKSLNTAFEEGILAYERMTNKGK